MQQLAFQAFYTKYGVRNLDQLMNPRVFDVEQLQLPLDSSYHYLDFDGISTGPNQNDSIFKGVKALIPVITIENLLIVSGTPRPNTVNKKQLINTHFQQNRHLRNIKDGIVPSMDRRTPLVYNYAVLARGYKYMQGQITNFQKNRNILATVISTINKSIGESLKNHFVFFNAPRLLPSVSQIEAAIKTQTVGTLKYFNEPETLLILELWKWLAKPRVYAVDDDSHDTVFKFIPEDKCHLVNFVFQENGKWIVVNLGILNSFRKTGFFKEETVSSDLALKSNIKVDPIQLAKRALHFFISVNALRSLSVISTSHEPLASDETNELEEDALEVKTVTDEDSDKFDKLQDEITDLIAQNTIPADAPSVVTTQELLDEQLSKIDEDLSLIGAVSDQSDSSPDKLVGKSEDVYASVEKKPHDEIAHICEKLVADSVMTPKEAEKMIQLGKRYEQFTMPNGQTLAEYIKINPESLKITDQDKKLVTESFSIPDKGMTVSSLNSFDAKYIKDILPKDTAAMILGAQEFGVAVTNIHIDRKEDILGAYDDYVVKLTPVIGQMSTIRFKIPVIKQDGSYKANNVIYRLRKQRADLPIRKVSPTRVALATYFGKTFINKATYASNDYSKWLEKQITSRILEKDPLFANAVLANVSDYQYKAPMCYTVISTIIRSIEINGTYYCFDHTLLEQDEYVKQNLNFKPQDDILIGYNTQEKSFVFVRPDASVYVVSDDNAYAKEIDYFESIFGIDATARPTEYTTVNVFGQSIPVGIVLGLLMGLSNLIETLKLEHRFEVAGTRVKLQPDEAAIRFNDRILIYSKKQRLASMIISGFSEFSNHLSRFSVFSFDSRGVYQNLLETADLPAKYIREIDLMSAMFVDPISKEILQTMNEPTTFKGLLFRASEMLLDSTHPEPMDPKYMRIKGYERIPGAVYLEMVNSLRAHNNKQGKRANRIEQKPYAVWTRIAEDPAKMQVQEINPIKAIKEVESATYAGEGGRMKRSMTRATRSYHPNDMGVISESTVDNSDVGININLSANPQLINLRGIQGEFSMEKNGATSLLSTSAMLAPFSNYDDQLGLTNE